MTDHYLLACGSRTWSDFDLLDAVLDKMTEGMDGRVHLVHGAANGADKGAARWARRNGHEVKAFPADWTTYRRSAGPIRNTEMNVFLQSMRALGNPVSAVAFATPSLVRSRGTADMVRRLRAAHINVNVVEKP